MSDATELWTAVTESYDSAGLATLTNIRVRSGSSINTTVGQEAAQSVIDLWPAYAQTVYDSTDALHVEVAKMGVIAMLWRRGGSAITIAKVEWDEVFGDDGIISKVKRTGPRAHGVIQTNSGLRHIREDRDGRKKKPWSEDLPTGFSPTSRSSEY